MHIYYLTFASQLGASASSACRACPVAPGDGAGVGGRHRSGVRDKQDPFRDTSRHSFKVW